MPNGNLLGNIVLPAGASRNNNTTATPFSVPFGCLGFAVVIDSEASGYVVVTGTNSALVAGATDLSQIGPATLQYALPPSSLAPVIAVRSLGAGGTVSVYQTDGKVQS